VWSFYRRLIQLRKEHPVIVYGSYEALLPRDKRVFAFRRAFEGQSLLVLCNFTGEEITDLDLAHLGGAAPGKLLIANYGAGELLLSLSAVCTMF